MRRLGTWLVRLLCFCALASAILMFIPTLLGMQRYVITGGSMTGSIPRGSVIYSRLTPVGQLKVGDVITFRPPSQTAPVTHRIVSIETDADGKPMFGTKGDFNQAADPWKMNLVEPRQARYVFHVPYAGYFFAGLAIRRVRMVVIGLPALLIAASLLWSLWKPVDDDPRPAVRERPEPADTGSRA